MGQNTIPLTLFEAAEDVDTGDVYVRDEVVLDGHELLPEIHFRLGSAIVQMCLIFIRDYDRLVSNPAPQIGEATYFPRRTPDDSKLDVDRSIRDQFNLLRVVDNERYPAFFEHLGKRFVIEIRESKQ